MSFRRFRSGSQSESTHREATDTFYSFRRIIRPFGSRYSFTERNRNLDRYNKPYLKQQASLESGFKPERRSRSSSFSSVVLESLNMTMRRQSVSGGRRHALPNKSWSPMKVYPGEAVGYRRLWMQDNPWPEQVAKEGFRREGGHDHMHRAKFSVGRRQQQEPGFGPGVPGATSRDPLNLAGYVSDGVVDEMLHQDVLLEKQRLMPANNLMPLDHRDPLGLMQSGDKDMNLCLRYTIKPKRKRTRTKKKENVSTDPSVKAGDGKSVDGKAINTVLNKAEVRQSSTEDSKDASSKASHTVVEAMETSNPATSEDNANQRQRADSETSVKENMEVSGQVSTTVISKSSNSSKPQAHTDALHSTDHKALKASLATGDVSQPGPSGQEQRGGGQKEGGERMDEGGDHSASSANEDDNNRSSGDEAKRRGRSASVGKRDHRKHSRQNSREQLDLKQVRHRALSFRYPKPQSPDDATRHPTTLKALRKALRIVPMRTEEERQILQERQEKERAFRKLWRPNLKSPAEKKDTETALRSFTASLPKSSSSLPNSSSSNPSSSSKPSTSTALTVDTTGQATEKNLQDTHPQGSVSRNVDSIISPVLRQNSAHITKRRRTTSECSSDSASGKKPMFRRSSSPQQGSSPSPRKVRRQSGGSIKDEQQSENHPQNTIKYSKNPAYKHGNYYRYYGYRTPAMNPDFRLFHFRKEWFEGRDVLDIGCNAGEVTLAVAQFFHPQKIVGMDIDPNLIRIARQNIRSHQTKANVYQMEKYPVSTTEYGPIEPLPALTNPSNMFPKNVMFMQGNYVLKSDEDLDYVKQEYDTILALSVTKWIHLNHGDEGLKRVFHRMFQQLRPGGHLILEPQPWASYRRRKKLTATIYQNFNSIQLKPNDFGAYLVNTVGFCKREFLGTPHNPSKGFQRSLWLFTKYKPTADNSPYVVPSETSHPPSTSPSHFYHPSSHHPSLSDHSTLPHPSISDRISRLAGYAATNAGASGGPSPGGANYMYPHCDPPRPFSYTPLQQQYQGTPEGHTSPDPYSPSYNLTWVGAAYPDPSDYLQAGDGDADWGGAVGDDDDVDVDDDAGGGVGGGGGNCDDICSSSSSSCSSDSSSESPSRDDAILHSSSQQEEEEQQQQSDCEEDRDPSSVEGEEGGDGGEGVENMQLLDYGQDEQVVDDGQAQQPGGQDLGEGGGEGEGVQPGQYFFGAQAAQGQVQAVDAELLGDQDAAQVGQEAGEQMGDDDHHNVDNDDDNGALQLDNGHGDDDLDNGVGGGDGGVVDMVPNGDIDLPSPEEM